MFAICGRFPWKAPTGQIRSPLTSSGVKMTTFRRVKGPSVTWLKARENDLTEPKVKRDERQIIQMKGVRILTGGFRE
jgi:hypothetical protein